MYEFQDFAHLPRRYFRIEFYIIIDRRAAFNFVKKSFDLHKRRITEAPHTAASPCPEISSVTFTPIRNIHGTRRAENDGFSKAEASGEFSRLIGRVLSSS